MAKKKRVNIAYPLMAVEIVLAVVFFVSSSSVLLPSDARDSDGTPSAMIISKLKSPQSSEEISLNTFPYGYIIARNWEWGRGDADLIARIKWEAEKEHGAGDIYLGHSFDGSDWEETGPLPASGEKALKLGKLSRTEINSLQIRWRGSDLDGREHAFARVEFLVRATNLLQRSLAVAMSMAFVLTLLLTYRQRVFK